MIHCAFAAAGGGVCRRGGEVIPHCLHALHTLRASNSSIHSPTSVLKVASDHTLKVWHRGLPNRNGVLLYKQLFSPVWRSDARCHIRKL